MTFWDGRRVLVTGGAGFIGSDLAKVMLDLGAEVHVADNFSRGTKENIQPFIDRIHLHVTDLTEKQNCIQCTKDMDYVFHLAASVGGIHYIEKENVEGSTPSILMNTHMLEAARINNIERFLFASSACVYAERSTELNEFKEEDAIPANPHTSYGWAKLLGEIQCKSYHADYGLKCSVPRIFNAYGENESLDSRWSHVIPSLIRKAVNFPVERFTVFGDGRQKRAFMYVRDCVNGLLVTMQNVTNADPVNLGSRELVSISELAQKVVNISGKKIPIEYDVSGPKGTHMYCADTRKMRSVLEWEPKVQLEQGLKRTYEWAMRKLGVAR